MGFEFGAGAKSPAKKAGMFAQQGEDPLANVQYTGNVEADAKAELDELQKGFRARRDAEAKRFEQATDSEYWFAVCFKSRADKDAFLSAIKASRLGDKYLDGYQLARLLKVDID